MFRHRRWTWFIQSALAAPADLKAFPLKLVETQPQRLWAIRSSPEEVRRLPAASAARLDSTAATEARWIPQATQAAEGEAQQVFLHRALMAAALGPRAVTLNLMLVRVAAPVTLRLPTLAEAAEGAKGQLVRPLLARPGP
jgi:hypothetical protein